MTVFDRTLYYQFAAIFVPREDGIPAEVVKSLPSIVGKGRSGLALRLGETPQQQQGLALQGTALVPAAAATWSAGSGIWRLVLSPDRLDLVFDALGYREVTDQHVTFKQAHDRVRVGFAEAVGQLEHRPV